MLPLDYLELSAAGEHPSQQLIVLHGILGSKSNWRSLCRKLVDRRPEWGVLIYDLPEHGESPPAQTPYSVEQIALHLKESIEAQDIRPTAILGHSFGGKVAFEYSKVALQNPDSNLQQIWSIDSMPGAGSRGGNRPSTSEIVAILANAPAEFGRRDEFVDYLCAQELPKPIAMWLGMNLKRKSVGSQDRFVFGPRPEVIRQLLEDFLALDLWPQIESTPISTHLVIGGASASYSDNDRKRATQMSQLPHVQTHTIEDASHWVHTDKPQALLDLLVHHLPTT